MDVYYTLAGQTRPLQVQHSVSTKTSYISSIKDSINKSADTNNLISAFCGQFSSKCEFVGVCMKEFYKLRVTPEKPKYFR